MPCRWKAVDGLVRALGALRAESFALEYDHAEPPVLEEAARTIGEAAHAIGATLDAPEDTERLLDACEAIVAARARLLSLRDARTRTRDLMRSDADLRRQAARELLEQIGGLATSG
jgi:hypothetical protein